MVTTIYGSKVKANKYGSIVDSERYKLKETKYYPCSLPLHQVVQCSVGSLRLLINQGNMTIREGPPSNILPR